MDFGQIEIDEFYANGESDLDRVRVLTQMMRQHQEAVVRIGNQRREVIRRLRKVRTPYRTIADACQVTDQALYADLRKHPES